jgi:phage N-6-adenine-methyltransferase
MALDVHFSSRTDEGVTPQWLFDALDSEFGFTLGPCSTHENAKCKRHFTIKENGLLQDWSGETVFMNPPYGPQIGQWMRKAYLESRKGAIVVCLVPARTDTKWWHSFAMRAEVDATIFHSTTTTTLYYYTPIGGLGNSFTQNPV